MNVIGNYMKFEQKVPVSRGSRAKEESKWRLIMAYDATDEIWRALWDVCCVRMCAHWHTKKDIWDETAIDRVVRKSSRKQCQRRRQRQRPERARRKGSKRTRGEAGGKSENQRRSGEHRVKRRDEGIAVMVMMSEPKAKIQGWATAVWAHTETEAGVRVSFCKRTYYTGNRWMTPGR